MVNNFPESHYDATKNAVMVSGIMRSGTTILGKLIGSFKNVEYAYEPSITVHINYLIHRKKIVEKLASDILRTYFAYEVMFNFHHARGYNMRPTDDSCIFNMKMYSEVMTRWEKIKSNNEAINLMRELKSRLVFKTPNVYPLIPVLLENFEGFKVVDIQRNLKSVLSSVMAKKWVTNRETELWPFVEDNHPIKAPYFIEEQTVGGWRNANLETKVVKIINKLVEIKLETEKMILKTFPNRYIVIKYEDLLENPKNEVIKIANFVDMQLTTKTDELINTIRPTERVYDVDHILEKCDTKSRKIFLDNSELSGYEN